MEEKAHQERLKEDKDRTLVLDMCIHEDKDRTLVLDMCIERFQSRHSVCK